jgi:hypothetical protein
MYRKIFDLTDQD